MTKTTQPTPARKRLRGAITRASGACLALLVAVIVLGAPASASASAGPWENPVFQEWQGAGEEEEGDCLYAAAAGWEAFELGLHPTETQVWEAYWKADLRRTPEALSSYWSRHAIDGVKARVAPVASPGGDAAYIVALDLSRLPSTAQWLTHYHAESASGYHAALMLEHSATGVLVVSWGLEWKLSWSEWNAMQPEYYAVRILPRKHR